MSAQKPMISPYEVNELTKYCLKILTYTDELRSDTALHLVEPFCCFIILCASPFTIFMA